MAVVRPRNDPVRLFGRRLLLLALILLALFGLWAVWGAYEKARESAALRDDAERELSDLQNRKDKLDGDIAELKTDRGVEAALREQYALAGRGEGVIVIVDPEKTQKATTTSPFKEWVHKLFPFW